MESPWTMLQPTMPEELSGGVGLILTEGVEVSHRAASGYPNVPNLETDEAKKMWEKVVSEVHKNKSSIFCQLWHVGGIRKPGMPPYPEVPGFTPSGYVVPGKKWHMKCHLMKSMN